MNRKVELGLVALVLVIEIGWIASLTGPGTLFEIFDRQPYDVAARHVIPDPPGAEEITIVLIDDESLARTGERWPLSRDAWARLIDRLNGFGPKAIVIDAWFESPAPREDVEVALDISDLVRDMPLGESEEGKRLANRIDAMAAERDGDRRFAEAIARSGRVILGLACINVDHDTRARLGLEGVAHLELDTPPGRALPCQQVSANLPRLAMSARRQAGVNVAIDEDGVSRRYPYMFSADGKTYPSLALAAALETDAASQINLVERAARADRGAPVLRYGWSENFRQVRYSDLMEVTDPSPALQSALMGRIVLIGVSALGTEDYINTPRERQVAGVYVHAQALADLIDEGYLLTESSMSRTALWGMAALLVLSALLGWRLHSATALIGFAILVCGIWLAFWVGALRSGQIVVLMPFVWGVCAWLLVRLAFVYVRAQAARKRESEIRRAFQHYLAPAVVQTLVDDPERLRLGGDRRELTAFFSDIRGFTTISEGLDPSELVVLLNECLGAMTEIILEEGGTIDKYIGDAVVAMFGAPIGEDEHAVRACRAALRCQSELARLRMVWQDRGLPELHVRIGLNSGTAVVGNMGSEQRFDYTMIGDAVNLAARLEQANKHYGTGILVGEGTLKLLGDRVAVREIDLLRVKGKKHAVRIGEVLGMANQIGVADRSRADLYARALAAYRDRRWDDAKEALSPLLALEDGPSKLLAERIEIFESTPPPAEWDGVFTMPS